jgi:hypothetical protein
MLKASQAKQGFIDLCGGETPLHQALKQDYFAVQESWEHYMDSLHRNGDITTEQYSHWLFPWANRNPKFTHSAYPFDD